MPAAIQLKKFRVYVTSCMGTAHPVGSLHFGDRFSASRYRRGNSTRIPLTLPCIIFIVSSGDCLSDAPPCSHAADDANVLTESSGTHLQVRFMV